MPDKDVFKILLDLPNRSGSHETWTPTLKYIVVVRDESSETEIAVVVASSRKSERLLKGYEVDFRSEVGGFPRDTIVDCRWIWTIPRAELGREQAKFTISDIKMNEIREAITIGLNLYV